MRQLIEGDEAISHRDEIESDFSPCLIRNESKHQDHGRPVVFFTPDEKVHAKMKGHRS